jgi:hypothetical protein
MRHDAGEFWFLENRVLLQDLGRGDDTTTSSLPALNGQLPCLSSAESFMNKVC